MFESPLGGLHSRAVDGKDLQLVQRVRRRAFLFHYFQLIGAGNARDPAVDIKILDIGTLIHMDPAQYRQGYVARKMELPLDNVGADTVFLPVMIVKKEKYLPMELSRERTLDLEGLVLTS